MENRLKPEDLARFRSPGEAQVSPDGSLVAYTLSVPDNKADKALTSLWVKPLNGGIPQRLTGSGKDRSPRWSKDGKRIAFISDRSGKPQIWLIDVAGGEAWRVPTEQSVLSISWSPDGKSIAFTSKDFTKSEEWVPYAGAPEKDRERAVAQANQSLKGAKQGGSDADGAPKVSDVKVITRFKYRADGTGYLGDLRSHVFVVAAPLQAPADDAPSNAERLTRDDFDHDSPAWSPDGKYIVLAALRGEDADYVQKQDFWLIHVESGRLVRLYTGDGPSHSMSFSPDGAKIAFAGHDGTHGSTTLQALWVIDVAGFIKDLEGRADGSVPAPLTQKDAKCLTRSLDKPLGPGSNSDVHYGSGAPFVWENDSTLLFLIGDRGAGALYRVSASPGNAQPRPTLVWGEDLRNLVSFDHAAGAFVFLIGAPDATEDLYSFIEDDGSLSRLTDANPWLSEISVGKTERITFKGAKGWDIDGFLTYPVGYQAKTKYPLALIIHGGPAGAFGPNFMYQHQILAAKGFAVLGTNPRGSTTYNQEFTNAVVGDWGGQDYLDIMAGVDEVIACGVADPDNLFVTGWSYGGFMTSWIVTQTNRFKAAVGGAIISDRYSMYSTEDIVLTGEHYFSGNPWDDPDKLLSRSAIAHIKNVTTPFMVLHGELDVRCPTSQGEEFYSSLKRLGKEAVFVRYPGEYHGFTRLTHRIDRFERTAAYFDYYAKKG